MRALIEFSIVFVLLLVINYLFVVRKNKKYNKDNVPVELFYIMNVYGIKKKDINYKNFVWLYSFVNSLIISVVYIIVVYLVKGIIFQILIGAVLLILLIIIAYGLIGYYYQRKGGK